MPTPTNGIVIVGAGASGLYAAARLKRAGLDVTILEATQQHGGRIRALLGFADFPVMVGAETLQADKLRPFSFLAKDITRFRPDSLVDTDGFGTLYALDQSWVWHNHDDPDLYTFRAIVNEACSYRGDDISIADYLHARKIGTGSRVWHLFAGSIGCEYGAHLNRLSLTGWAREHDQSLTGNASWLLSESFLDVLDDLYFEPVKSHIQFGSRVVRVSYADSCVRVLDHIGRTYECSAVLITVPLSILQDRVIDFDPALPESKTRAIDGIGMGKGIKAVLRFTHCWWPAHMYDAIIKGTTSLLWNPGKAFPRANQQVLTAYMTGDSYDRVSPSGDDAVKLILADCDAAFGGRMATRSFVSAHVTDWGREDSFRGVYSFPIIGTYPTIGRSKRHTLAEPVHGRIFFAGEATSDDHAATVHGALESGDRAANEILTAFQRQ